MSGSELKGETEKPFQTVYNCHSDIIAISFYKTTWAIISFTFPIKVLLAAFKPNIKCRSGHLSPLHAVQSLSTKARLSVAPS